MKNEICQFIEGIRYQLTDVADKIFDNPEVGLKEFKASNLLVDQLSNSGFNVEKGVAGLKTAFRATYKSGTGGISFGLLCEYDAIENFGHACGHHLQGPSIFGAALAIKTLIKGDYNLIVYGTPAEETTSGKLEMIKKGCFKDIDVALMMHAGPNTTTDIKSMALSKFQVDYFGRSAHAAIKPEAGRSAFDALLLSFNAIEYMREHVADDLRIHYTVLDAGGVANVVPSKASGSYYIRSYCNKDLEDAVNRFKKIIEGAALMTGTDYNIKVEKEMLGKIPVLKLNKLLMDNAELIGAPQMRQPREKTGSTDFGSVMHMVPGSCIRTAFVPEGTSSHSQEYLEAGKSNAAHEALIVGSKVLALSIYDMINNREVLNAIKNEFDMKKLD